MMRVWHTCGRFYHLLFWLVFWAVLVCGITLTSALYWLSKNPTDITPWVPTIGRLLGAEGVEWQVDRMLLTYNQRLRMEADNLVISENKRTLARVESFDVSFSNRWLALGRLYPKHIVVDNVVAHLHKGKDTLALGSLKLYTGAGEDVATQEIPDIFALLAQWENLATVGALRTVKLSNFNLLLKDAEAKVDWLFENGAFVFSRYPTEGESLRLTGLIRQKQVPTPMPVLVTASHPRGQTGMVLSLQVDDSTTDFVANYLPPTLRKFLNTRGRVELGAVLMPGNALVTPHFTLYLDQTSVFPDMAYTHPLELKHAVLRGWYAPSPTDVLTIHSLAAEDKAGWQFTVSGSIAGLESSPTVNLQVTASPTTLRNMVSYLPDKLISHTVTWLNARDMGIQGRNIRATYNGSPAAMPHCGEACGISVTAEITEGSLKFWEFAEPLKNIKGRYHLAGTRMNIVGESGTWAGQSVRDVSVTIDNMFVKELSNLHIAGTAQGELPALLPQLKKGLELKEDLPAATGTHTTRFQVMLPLLPGTATPTLAQIGTKVESDLTNLTMPLPQLGKGMALQAPIASLTVREKTLAFQTNGSIAGAPLQVGWQMNLLQPDTSVQATLKGNIPIATLQKLLNDKTMTGTGSLGIEGQFAEVSPKNYTFGLTATGQDAALSLDLLKWQKPKNEAVKLVAQGRVNVAQASPTFEVTDLSLTGKNVNVAGNITRTASGGWQGQLNPFQVGGQHGQVVLSPNRIALIGKRFDGRGLKLFENTKGTDLPDLLDIDLDIGTLRLAEAGEVKSLKGTFSRRNGFWETGDVAGDAEGSFRIKLESLPTNRLLTLNAYDMGAVLRALNLYNGLRGGQLEGQMYLTRDGRGEGFINVRDVRATELPVLAQLLSLLSLEPLFDAKSGTKFSKVNIPLTLEPNVLHINKAKLDGPSLALRFNGFYTMPENGAPSELNMDGRLIPAAGLNKTLGSIPLIGLLLAGSQEGLVVADFKVKGLAADPKVSVKPLSLITPGLLKDIFGTGGDFD
ncbi:MAG: AsmA-like C-terminal domain-containing protein [Alphaproteobacteria bacterium]